MTLDQVLQARRTATHPGPPQRRIQFMDTGLVKISAGKWTAILAQPNSSEPRSGWRHRSGCRCSFCRAVQEDGGAPLT